MTIGALCGGLALAELGAVSALGLDLASFAVSAFFYAGIDLSPVDQPAEEDDSGSRPRLSDLFGRRTLLVAVAAYAASRSPSGS
jgi:hypothetical protein